MSLSYHESDGNMFGKSTAMFGKTKNQKVNDYMASRLMQN